jgi:hypothetical protein
MVGYIIARFRLELTDRGVVWCVVTTLRCDCDCDCGGWLVGGLLHLGVCVDWLNVDVVVYTGTVWMGFIVFDAGVFVDSVVAYGMVSLLDHVGLGWVGLRILKKLCEMENRGCVFDE